MHLKMFLYISINELAQLLKAPNNTSTDAIVQKLTNKIPD